MQVAISNCRRTFQVPAQHQESAPFVTASRENNADNMIYNDCQGMVHNNLEVVIHLVMNLIACGHECPVDREW
jgi:hypothetical protein